MTMTDPIADMLTRIRNANVVKHDSVDVPASNMKKTIAEIEKQCGPVDILVNGAGITRDNTLRKMTPDQWQQVIKVNLDSVYNCTQPLIEGMTPDRPVPVPGLRTTTARLRLSPEM